MISQEFNIVQSYKDTGRFTRKLAIHIYSDDRAPQEPGR